jgi:hypothetical protein
MVGNVLDGGESVTAERKLASERWQEAFNAFAYALNATALFLIAISIAALERAREYFQQKEYAWLVPGGVK